MFDGFQRHEKVEQAFSKYFPPRRDGVLVLLDEAPTEVVESGICYKEDFFMGAFVPGTVISVGSNVHSLSSGCRIAINRVYGYEIFHNDSVLCKLKLVTENQIDFIME